MKTVGEKIRDRRIRMNLTQTELAEMAEVSLRTISKYEKAGVVPSVQNLRRLCKVLGVSEAYLRSPEIEDESYGLEEEPYVETARNAYGTRGASEMQSLLEANKAMLAGGSVPQEDKDLFFQAIMEAYLETKQAAKEKFTPKKYRE